MGFLPDWYQILSKQRSKFKDSDSRVRPAIIGEYMQWRSLDHSRNGNYGKGEIRIVRESLVRLKAVPIGTRYPQAVQDSDEAGMNADYSQFPPPAGMIMVKRWKQLPSAKSYTDPGFGTGEWNSDCAGIITIFLFNMELQRMLPKERMGKYLLPH